MPATASSARTACRRRRPSGPISARAIPDIELHLIGPLQSNKTKEAVQLFDAIHTIDRPKIAKAIAEEQTKQGKRLKLFIEVNTGEEPQKAGIMPRETEAFARQCREEFGLEIAGLMCIPPTSEEPAVHFAFLAKLAREAGREGAQHGHERRLRDRGRLRRHLRPCRLGDFRCPRALASALRQGFPKPICRPPASPIGPRCYRSADN